jgi:hypothetical protein
VWALEHGVQPPSFVRFTDAQWIAAANAVKPGSASCGACVVRIRGMLAQGIALGVRAHAPDRQACCAAAPARHAAAAPACCAAKSDAHAAADAAPGALPSSTDLPGLSALGCKGASALMLVPTVPAAPAPLVLAIVTLHLPGPPTVVAAASLRAPSDRALDVPAPPPKRAA